MLRTSVLLLAATLLAGGCGSDDGGRAEGGDETQVSCSRSTTRTLDLDQAAGPAMDRDVFTQTSQGRVLETFFVGGDGAPEGGPYLDVDGFTIVSRGYVVGFRGNELVSDFVIESGRVQTWGSCSPIVVRGDLVAERWRTAGPIDDSATEVPIIVEGGACVDPEGEQITTEIVDIVVEEGSDVAITVWTRDTWEGGFCAGVGIELKATAVLDAPLSGRQLLDGGLYPPMPIRP